MSWGVLVLLFGWLIGSDLGAVVEQRRRRR